MEETMALQDKLHVQLLRLMYNNVSLIVNKLAVFIHCVVLLLLFRRGMCYDSPDLCI